MADQAKIKEKQKDDVHFTDVESFPHLICGANLVPEKNWSFFIENITCNKCVEMILGM